MSSKQDSRSIVSARSRPHIVPSPSPPARASRDPLQQLLIFVGLLEEFWRDLTEPYPGCLFASYVYAARLFDDETHGVIRRAVWLWRDALAVKLREAAERHPPCLPLDVEAVADLITVILEGAFVVSKTMDDAEVVSRQVRQYRNYLELLFGVVQPQETG